MTLAQEQQAKEAAAIELARSYQEAYPELRFALYRHTDGTPLGLAVSNPAGGWDMICAAAIFNQWVACSIPDMQADQAGWQEVAR